MDNPQSSRPRLLSRSGVPGYTHVAMLSMTGEPEAVSEDDQWLLTERSRQLHDATLQTEWQKASARIHAARAHFEKVGRPPQDLQHQLRGIERATRAVDKRFG